MSFVGKFHPNKTSELLKEETKLSSSQSIKYSIFSFT